MDINKLTPRAQEAVLEAQNLSIRIINRNKGEHLHFVTQNEGDT